METIQIHVSIELNLSQDVKNFIASTVANFLTGTPTAPKSVAPAPTVSTTPAPTAPASVAPKSVVPAPAPAPAPTVPTASTVPTAAPTIEQVRQALAAKVNGHREEIKAKLNSFGAPSVTKLDPAKYSEMLEFLVNLS